jgi:hypothetical protein
MDQEPKRYLCFCTKVVNPPFVCACCYCVVVNELLCR